jgi:flagellar secretion chaperone FliS
MSYNAHDAYLEGRILSAEPLELVRMLNQGCTVAVKDARRQLAAGKIEARGRAVVKAWEILAELAGALDHEQGGDISFRLGQLYDYMQRRLLEANMQQSDGPLVEVLSLLATLSEAWDGLKPAAKPSVEAENPWGPPPPPEPTAACASQGWSF